MVTGTFSSILHPDDKEGFAISVSTLNNQQQMTQYQWKILSRGMKNIPTICQYDVHKVAAHQISQGIGHSLYERYSSLLLV